MKFRDHQYKSQEVKLSYIPHINETFDWNNPVHAKVILNRPNTWGSRPHHIILGQYYGYTIEPHYLDSYQDILVFPCTTASSWMGDALIYKFYAVPKPLGWRRYIFPYVTHNCITQQFNFCFIDPKYLQ